MFVSPYTAAVFVHLIAAFLMVGGNTTARIGLTLMRSASNAGEALGAYKVYAAAPRLIVPTVAVTVASGIGIAWYIGALQQVWAGGSVVLWIGLNVLRAVVVVPPARALQAAAQQAAVDPAAHGQALLTAARHRNLHLGHLGMEVINFLIIVLMVFKPA
ncbi:DUF2269 family protein [Hyalangium versicolor]|uniref:DUF2269 family protein n=1 Tax=Hyalangium versicolor TaxID=2861190 RepID=UPI001CD03CEE|nr:DUF2269 family protein [Hyalangium versicolor]